MECALEPVLLCLRTGASTEQLERLASATTEEWSSVLAAAHQHKVAPLLYHRLKRLGVALPGCVSRELRACYRRNAVQNLRLKEQLESVVRALGALGIPVIVLKGMHVAEAVYGNLALRTMTDVDLLAKEEDLPRIDGVLLGLGFRPLERNRVLSSDKIHFQYALAGTSVLIEVHWTLIASSYRLRIDGKGLWARAQRGRLTDVPALVLSPEDLTLHLCLHAAQDLFNTICLRMLCDLNEVVQRHGAELDWPALSARAQDWGIARATYLFLALARETLHARVPDDALAALRPSDFDERYLSFARDHILSGRHCDDGSLLRSPSAARLPCTKGLLAKLDIVCNRLLVPREAISRTYGVPIGSWLVYLCYAMRAKDLSMRYGSTIWDMLRGDVRARSVMDSTNQVAALQEWLLRA